MTFCCGQSTSASPSVYSRRLLVCVRAFRRLLVYVRAFGFLFERILTEVITDSEVMASVAKLYLSNGVCVRDLIKLYLQ